MKKKYLYIWACDYKNYTGEGNLARLFIKQLKSKNNIKVFSVSKIKGNNPYISIMWGIIFCWKKFLNKKKIAIEVRSKSKLIKKISFFLNSNNIRNNEKKLNTLGKEILRKTFNEIK